MSPLWLLSAGLAVGVATLDAWAARGAAAGARATRRDVVTLAASLTAVALFALAAWRREGGAAALAFTSAWALEAALSVDNLFVFLLVFRAFGVPPALAPRVLRWGILGAVVMRGAFIAVGLTLVRRLDGVFFAFGALLVVSGVKVLVDFARGGHPDGRAGEGEAWLVRALRRLLPLTSDLGGGRFTVREAGRLRATPMLAALFAVELGDIVFAVDSVPAVLSVTQEPIWVVTSNLFAILGLRVLFRLLGQAAARLRYLELGLAGILLFVGAKMLLHRTVEIGVGPSLAAVLGMFFAATLASLLAPRAR